MTLPVYGRSVIAPTDSNENFVGAVIDRPLFISL